MTTRRTYTLLATVLLLSAATGTQAQETDNMAEDRDIGFIEQCLQRAVEQQIPEDRIDAFIDRCINEFYERSELNSGAESGASDGDGKTQGGADGDAGAIPGD
jgi:hypothetical protein